MRVYFDTFLKYGFNLETINPTYRFILNYEIYTHTLTEISIDIIYE